MKYTLEWFLLLSTELMCPLLSLISSYSLDSWLYLISIVGRDIYGFTFSGMLAVCLSAGAAEEENQADEMCLGKSMRFLKFIISFIF
jgi:hypothetical protein